MALRIAFVALLVAVSVNGFASNEDDLSRLIDRAKAADIAQRPRLYTEIAERELRLADQSCSANEVEKADDAVRVIVSSADKASESAIQSGKHLKDTEIAMRKMSVKLRDMKRKLAFDDQGPLQAAADHLET